MTNADSIIMAIRQPDIFSTDQLNTYLNDLMNCNCQTISDCQKSFKEQVIPKRFQRFRIDLSELFKFMVSQYDDNPNKWPMYPDVKSFIDSQYEASLAPQIVEKINSESPEKLKQKVLNLAKENPEIGLLFWEGNDEL